MATFLLCFLCALSSLYIAQAQAQARAPHGIIFENPVAFSPSAYDFFHPNTHTPKAVKPCDESNCAPMSGSSAFSTSSAVVRATPAHESKESTTAQGSGSSKSKRPVLGAGGISGIVFGFVFAVLSGIGVYYIMVTRRTNISRSNSVQPDSAC
ncbi:hypothetical protein MKW94_010765 [Papaver nudicaule]|uniref:Transmembrane protein n=1 Tax=Papaver nudicaule TaxID=74823 RepID=A0AA41UXC0_PAPNU|nr:hypothetical protein [Papaver nudicaule]